MKHLLFLVHWMILNFTNPVKQILRSCGVFFVCLFFKFWTSAGSLKSSGIAAAPARCLHSPWLEYKDPEEINIFITVYLVLVKLSL